MAVRFAFAASRALPLVLLLLPASASAQDAPTAWQGTWDILLETVCVDPARDDPSVDRRQAADLARSGRCAPPFGAPFEASNWALTDCRECAQIVAPDDPAGDRASFGIDRLRAYPATDGLFAVPGSGLRPVQSPGG